MTDENVNSNIDMAQAELQNLVYFFEVLSYYEREIVIEGIRNYLNDISTTTPLEHQKKMMIEVIQRKVEGLALSNAQSKIVICQQIINGELPLPQIDPKSKPCWEESWHIIQSLSMEELLELRHYLSLSDTELVNGKTTDIYQLLEDAGKNRTLCMFFAMRNWLGKRAHDMDNSTGESVSI